MNRTIRLIAVASLVLSICSFVVQQPTLDACNCPLKGGKLSFLRPAHYTKPSGWWYITPSKNKMVYSIAEGVVINVNPTLGDIVLKTLEGDSYFEFRLLDTVFVASSQHINEGEALGTMGDLFPKLLFRKRNVTTNEYDHTLMDQFCKCSTPSQYLDKN